MRCKQGSGLNFIAVILLVCPVFLLLSTIGSNESKAAGTAVSHPVRSPVQQDIIAIRLRLHLADSSMNEKEALAVAEEMRHIWLSQADICFQIEIVKHDDKVSSGIDLWFERQLQDWNGYYVNDHQIFVRDYPELKSSSMPSRFAAARTASHELGHALGLGHRQESDDNLMRSKTYGWQLNSSEVAKARAVAMQKGVIVPMSDCSQPAVSPMKSEPDISHELQEGNGLE